MEASQQAERWCTARLQESNLNLEKGERTGHEKLRLDKKVSRG